MDEHIFFPKQKDDYNCGTATVATIGIILRDLLPIDQSQVEFLFEDMFAESLLPTLTEETIVEVGNQMVLNKEFFCMMPVSMLIELPKTMTDYLSELHEGSNCRGIPTHRRRCIRRSFRNACLA